MGEGRAENLLGLRHQYLSQTSFDGWPPSYPGNVALLSRIGSSRGSKLSLILLMLLFWSGLEPWDGYVQWLQSEPLLALILLELLLCLMRIWDKKVLTRRVNYQFFILVILLQNLIHMISEFRKRLNVELGCILFWARKFIRSRISIKLKLLTWESPRWCLMRLFSLRF